jgi:hypothetical protein
MKNPLNGRNLSLYGQLLAILILAMGGCTEMNEDGSVTLLGGEMPVQEEVVDGNSTGTDVQMTDDTAVADTVQSQEEASNEERPGNETVAGRYEEGILAGIAIPGTVVQSTKTGIEYGLHALYCASYMAGGQRLVSTGTMTLNGPGAVLCPINGLSFAYSASPSDRLVVKMTNNELGFSVKVNDLRGNLVEGPQAFVDNNHRLDVELTIEGQGQVQVVSESQGRDRTLTVNGDVTLKGGTYAVNLRLVGNEYFENGSSGSEYRDNHTVTGQIHGPNVRAQVQETWEYIMVCTARRSRSTGRRCSSDAKRRFSNRWVQNGVEYVLNDGFTNANFRDGKPNSDELINGFWGAGGVLTQDGSPIGEIRFLPDSTGAQVGFYLVIGGEKVGFQSWLTHVVRD